MFEKKINRRKCIKTMGVMGLGLPLNTSAFSLEPEHKAENPFFTEGIHIFSKHLQWLDYEGMAKAASQMGFDGVDLTVRPKGHVLPENVEKDLPKAVAAVRKAGLKADLITTAITAQDEKHTEKILKTASQLGIKYYRMGWLKYDKNQAIEAQIEQYKKQLKALEEMNQHYQIHGAYQNHSGNGVGSAVWDIWMLIKDLNPEWLGCRFDVRHAMVEGMKSWKLGLNLLQKHILSFDLKDFTYDLKELQWKTKNTPIGEGIIDFADYFQTLKQLKMNAPFTLHTEYDLGGANKGASELKIPSKKVIERIKTDLERIKVAMNGN